MKEVWRERLDGIGDMSDKGCNLPFVNTYMEKEGGVGFDTQNLRCLHAYLINSRNMLLHGE